MLKTLATATLLTASSLADDSVNAGDISVETMGASGTFQRLSRSTNEVLLIMS